MLWLLLTIAFVVVVFVVRQVSWHREVNAAIGSGDAEHERWRREFQALHGVAPTDADSAVRQRWREEFLGSNEDPIASDDPTLQRSYRPRT